MSDSTIGSNIAQLRKENNVTQEKLANALNISIQAVSKWETNNGSPDSGTIPYIADFFGVSIDRLYGRKSYDKQTFQDHLLEYLVSFPLQERLRKAFEMQVYAPFVFVDLAAHTDIDLAAMLKQIGNLHEQTYANSQFFNASGLSMASLDPALPFSLIMPEPPTGWAGQLDFNDSLGQLFRTLGDENNLKAILMLHSRQNKPFTTKLLEKELNISPSSAANIITELMQYDMLKLKELELDGDVMTFYELNPNMALIPFITFAKQLIDRATVFFFHYIDRNDQPFITRKEQ